MNKWILLMAAIMATFPGLSQTGRGLVSPLWEQPVRKSFKALPDPDNIVRMEPEQEDAYFWACVLDEGKKSKTAVFQFKNISAGFETDYLDNARMLAILDSIFSDFSILDQVEYITITGASSPDGYTDRNDSLAADRAMVIRNYILKKYPFIDRNQIRSFSTGQYWDGLRQLIENDRLTPSRDAALRIINSNQSGEVKRRQLQQLSSRRTYNYLLNNTFSHLRVCAVHIIFYDEEFWDEEDFMEEEIYDEINVAPVRETRQPVISERENGYTVIPEPGTRYTVIPIPGGGFTVIPEPGTHYTVIPRSVTYEGVPTERTQPERDMRRDVGQPTVIERRERRETPYSRDPRYEKMLFALKTNLLFDVATAVNFELELPIEDRISLAGEYIFPWWLLNEKQYCLQLIAGNLELRYWTGNRINRPRMTGLFGGLFFGGGYYDLEFGDKGYQGEIKIMMGLSGGYAHEVSRDGKWRMEYSLGLGFMSTDYREYKPKVGIDEDWHLILQKSGRQSYFGPLRAKISLVRTINRR